MSKIYRGLAFMVLVVFSVVSRAELPDFRDLVKETSPAVVNISTVQHIEAAGFQQRYGLPQDVP
ncbi:MAG: hypothetical protein CMI13_14820, partial [Oleibacter sp.]|nr:hypothetical protein [Thalassolituus sp.]